MSKSQTTTTKQQVPAWFEWVGIATIFVLAASLAICLFAALSP